MEKEEDAWKKKKIDDKEKPARKEGITNKTGKKKKRKKMKKKYGLGKQRIKRGMKIDEKKEKK